MAPGTGLYTVAAIFYLLPRLLGTVVVLAVGMVVAVNAWGASDSVVAIGGLLWVLVAVGLCITGCLRYLERLDQHR